MNSTTNSTTPYTIGLDLGDRRYAVGVLNAAGDIVAEKSESNLVTVFSVASVSSCKNKQIRSFSGLTEK